MKNSVIIALSLAFCSQLTAQTTVIKGAGEEPFWDISLTTTDNKTYQAVFGQPEKSIKATLSVQADSDINNNVFYTGQTDNSEPFSVVTIEKKCQDNSVGANWSETITVILGKNIYQGCGGYDLDKAAKESGEESGEGNGMAEYFDFLMHTLSHSKNPKSAQRLLASQDKWSDYVTAHCAIFTGFTDPKILQAKEQCESILSKQRAEVMSQLAATFDKAN